MANYTVTMTRLSAYATKVEPPSIDYLRPGDTITFTGGTASGFQSGWWTKTGSIRNTSNTITASHEGQSDVITCRADSSSGSANFTATVSVRDNTPNAYSLNDISNTNPKARYEQQFRLEGFNSWFDVSVSGGVNAHFKLRVYDSDLGRWTYAQFTSFTCKEPMDVWVVSNAPFDYGQSTTVTVNAGGVIRSFKINTLTYPSVETKIEFPIKSGTIKLSDVRKFFGYYGQYGNLLEYVRGGGLVPSIADNSGIPTSPPIRLTDFYGSAAALYFIFKPSDKEYMADSRYDTGTAELSWNVETEYAIGYGRYTDDLEYRYVFTRTDDEPSSNDAYISFEGPSSWTSGAVTAKVKYNIQSFKYIRYTGTLTLYARNALDNSIVISKTVNWVLGGFTYGARDVW